MKRFVIIALAIACGIAFTASAAEETTKEKTKPTPEQRQLMKQMVTKYDANGDKKLDKEERAKISAEDKAKMKEAGVGQRKAGEKKAAAEAKKETGKPEKKAK